MAERRSNILDPIHDELDPRVWDNPLDPQPILKPNHARWILTTCYKTFLRGGYEGIEDYLKLIFTGSLTTYQYSDRSDCDISCFVEFAHFPEWSRAEMIGLMIEAMDTKKLPGTPHDMQFFIQPSHVKPEDIFKPGLRAGWDIVNQTWLVPPDRSRAHDIEIEMTDTYTGALEAADKMDRLLKFEPHKAAMYWHQLHHRRSLDQRAGKGDFSPSNIVYKFLVNEPGMIPKIEQALGQKIQL